MKLTVTVALLSLANVISLWAQPSITLLTFESYSFPDKFDTQYGSAKVMDGFQWGGGLEFRIANETAVELIYQYLNTDAYYQGADRRYDGSIGVNFILVGSTWYLPVNDKNSGFGTLDLGVGWFNASTSLESETATKFCIGGRLGLRIAASESVSARIHHS